MKAITFTTRNVTAGQRDAAGQMVLRTLGDITVTLQEMTRAELAEWEWATDLLNTHGLDEKTFRLTVNGWKVIHAETGTVGVLLQGAGTRVHVEWYDPANDDFFSAGDAANLRHGAAYIVDARQRAGHGLPVDFVPEPVKVSAPVHPVWLADGTQVRYHGSIEQLRGEVFRVYECECFDCDGYELRPVDWYAPVARHVGWDSVTALEAVAA